MTIATEDTLLRFILVIAIIYKKMYSGLPFLSERMKMGKCRKPMCNMYDKKNSDVHIKALRMALEYGLTLEKVDCVTELNQT